MIRRFRPKRRSATVDHPFRLAADVGDPRAWEVYQRLLRDRIVLVAGTIDDRAATLVIAQLLHLAKEDAKAPIRLFVNSPGGVVTSSLAIYDTMLDVAPPVETTCVGQAAGMAVLLLAAGQPGRRAAIPAAQVLATRLRGSRPDDDVTTAELERLRAVLDECFRKHTGRNLEALVEAGPVDAAGAVELGIVDTIIQTAHS